MMGLAVLAGIAIYIGVFWLVVRALKTKWTKSAAILVALAIPFWDLPIGYYNFYVHCSSDAGLKIGTGVRALDSILIDSSAGYTPEEVSRFGFKVIEYASAGKFIRYTTDSSGLAKSIHTAANSRVTIKFKNNEALSWNLVRSSYTATNLENQEAIATQTTYRWLGVWWQALAGGLFGSGSECSGAPGGSLLALLARGT